MIKLSEVLQKKHIIFEGAAKLKLPVSNFKLFKGHRETRSWLNLVIPNGPDGESYSGERGLLVTYLREHYQCKVRIWTEGNFDPNYGKEDLASMVDISLDNAEIIQKLGGDLEFEELDIDEISLSNHKSSLELCRWLMSKNEQEDKSIEMLAKKISSTFKTEINGLNDHQKEELIKDLSDNMEIEVIVKPKYLK